MSRLESAIRRLQAQRACLDWAVSEIAYVPGPILELGLGNGRTYDHLRRRLPGRRIYVFERKVAAHPDCTPDDQHLFEGDFRDTLPGASNRIGQALGDSRPHRPGTDNTGFVDISHRIPLMVRLTQRVK